MLILCGPFPTNRARIVKEAFQKLDVNGNGTLEVGEVKEKFDATRHPDVKAGISSVAVVRSNFFDTFTSYHSATKGFSGDKSVSLEEFVEYHHYLNSHFERDAEFRNFVIGVWNIDITPVQPTDFQGKHVEEYGKNSREQWKYENHKSVFGQRDPQILTYPQPEEEKVYKTPKDEMPVAGSRGWDKSNQMGSQNFVPGDKKRPAQ